MSEKIPKREWTIPGRIVLLAVSLAILSFSGVLVFQLLINNNRITSLLVLAPKVEFEEKDGWLGAQAAADSLSIRLMHVPNMRIIGRESALVAANQGSARDAAIETRAMGVLFGRITRKKDGYQLVWTLMDARDGKTRGNWTFAGNSQAELLSKWFSEQKKFARELLVTIKADVDEQTAKRVEQRLTTSPAAWIEYERGQNSRFAESIAAFQSALVADIEFGLAYSGLANRQMDLGESLPDGRGDIVAAGYMLDKAEQFSPDLGLVYAARGRFLALSYSLEPARKAFERGIQLAPGYHAGHEWFTRYYWLPQTRVKQAAGAAKRAADLNPLSVATQTTLALPFIGTRQYREAKAPLEAAARLDPTYRPAQRLTALLPVWETLVPRPEPYVKLSNKTIAPPLTTEQARVKLEEIVEGFKNGPRVTALEYASVLGALGMKEDALYVLEQGWDRKDASLLWMAFDPGLEKLRGEPRFAALVKQLGIAAR